MGTAVPHHCVTSPDTCGWLERLSPSWRGRSPWKTDRQGTIYVRAATEVCLAVATAEVRLRHGTVPDGPVPQAPLHVHPQSMWGCMGMTRIIHHAYSGRAMAQHRSQRRNLWRAHMLVAARPLLQLSASKNRENNDISTDIRISGCPRQGTGTTRTETVLKTQAEHS